MISRLYSLILKAFYRQNIHAAITNIALFTDAVKCSAFDCEIYTVNW